MRLTAPATVALAVMEPGSVSELVADAEREGEPVTLIEPVAVTLLVEDRVPDLDGVRDGVAPVERLAVGV